MGVLEKTMSTGLDEEAEGLRRVVTIMMIIRAVLCFTNPSHSLSHLMVVISKANINYFINKAPYFHRSLASSTLHNKLLNRYSYYLPFLKQRKEA